jgi:hypothetical protein
MLKFETMAVSITVCPIGKKDIDSGTYIMVGSIGCSHCPCYKGRGAYHNTIICEAEAGNVNGKNC